MSKMIPAVMKGTEKSANSARSAVKEKSAIRKSKVRFESELKKILVFIHYSYYYLFDKYIYRIK